MTNEKDIAKVVLVDEHEIVIDFGNGKSKILKPRQVSQFIRPGDSVRHCEHGFYDIVDDEGNLVFRNKPES